MPPRPQLHIRPATPDDIPLILQLIRDLAEYERDPHAAVATEALIRRHLFADSFPDHPHINSTPDSPIPRQGPVAECLIAELAGEPHGFALFFHNFSTWRGRPGLYLEDLFVRPAARGRGLGKALLIELARIAKARDCARMEWAVLDWNTPAIDFYKALGARPMDEWTIYRMESDAISRLAACE